MADNLGLRGFLGLLWQRSRLGTIALALGIGTVGTTVIQTADRLTNPPPAASCERLAVPERQPFILCDKLLETNRKISLVVDWDAVLGKHFDKRYNLKKEVEEAQEEIKKLEGKSDAPSNTRRETEQRRLREAREKIDTLPRHGELTLFVEGARIAHSSYRVAIPDTLPTNTPRQDTLTLTLYGRGTPKGPAQGNPPVVATGLWKQVFADRISNGIAPARVGLSVLTGSETPAEAQAGPEFLAAKLVDFMVYDWKWTFVGGLGFTLALIGFVLVASSGGLLRERPRSSADPSDNPPFSLARAQFLVWSVCILASFYFLLTITGEYAGVLSGSALGLLGISIGTTTAAKSVEQVFDAAKIAPDAQSRGFVIDLISGPQGASLVRLQHVIWTILFVGIFVIDVIFRLAMPTFDPAILFLLGLSSAGYVTTKATGG